MSEYVEQIQPRAVKIKGEVLDSQQYIVGMEIPAHDHLSLTEDTLTDTWVYRSGGGSGSIVATVTITYTDSGKGTISTVAKT